jgi:hypothetical protein
MHGDLETLEARMQSVKWNEQHWAKLMDRYTPKTVDGKARFSKSPATNHAALGFDSAPTRAPRTTMTRAT